MDRRALVTESGVRQARSDDFECRRPPRFLIRGRGSGLLRSPGVAPLPIDAVEPLPSIRAAVFYRNVADGRAREEAAKARGDGATWAEVAAAAGIVDDPEQDRSAAELAYEWASPRPSMRFDEVNVYWTCGTCGERVKDHGPLGGSHPSDQESGHTEECARHAADIAAWKTATGWE
jgi:hypothetical protein